MTWKPELPPDAETSRRTRMEWLVRSFRKISQWSQRVLLKGHGGLYLSTPTALSPPIVLTTTFQKIIGFDMEVNPNPIGVGLDVAASKIQIKEPGVWFFDFAAVGEIVPFSVNQPQTIEVAIYNETKGTSSIVGYHPVPRYSDVFDVSLAGQRTVPGTNFDINDWLSLWIRIRYATPAVTVNTTEDLEISAFKVG